jgi:release factor glutamine methyltransferase
MMMVLRTDRAGLYTRHDDLSAREAKALGRALCQRCSGTPLQHLTGEQAFRRISVLVRPGVFIPRPETEILVDVALRAMGDAAAPVVVDVGTGTGAIALAIKDEAPDAAVFATDVSSEAVELARDNAARLGLDVRVLEGDLLEPLPPELQGAVDVVVSNPPYIGEEEYRDLPPDVLVDPRDALVGGIDLVERLARAARPWLGAGGVLAMEIGATQGVEAAEVLKGAGYGDGRIESDLTGRDRVVVGRGP